jgi:hypothetical protein
MGFEIGVILGAVMGASLAGLAKQAHVLASSPEQDLIGEIKKRRARKRIEAEEGAKVETELGK